MRVWINGDIKIGTIGYLVETVVEGRTSWSLHDRPVKGWCGVGKVMRRSKTRERAQILRLHRDKRDAFLLDDGHPELVPARRVAESDVEGAVS
jgi:hypothetical protein